MEKKSVIVNATALYSGGGLRILHQFLEEASPSYDYEIFINQECNNLPKKQNINYIKCQHKNWIARIAWDFVGLRKYIEKNKISPILFISLQNTTIGHFTDIPQIIYLHQPLPFSEYKWSITKRGQVKLFLYKWIYPYFITRFLKKNDHIVVQTQWMLTAVCKRNWLPKENVHIIKPSSVMAGFVEKITSPIIKGEYIFYPASHVQYKNHIILAKALANVAKNNHLKLVVTIRQGDNRGFDECVAKLGLKSKVIYLGYVDRPSIENLYQHATAIAFPSKIETFGFPLVEAANFGKIIIVANAAYAKEVLDGYIRVVYCHVDNELEWAAAFDRSIKEPTHLKVSSVSFDSGWSDFFSLIERIAPPAYIKKIKPRQASRAALPYI